MIGLKLGKRHKQWPNNKMCLASYEPTCIYKVFMVYYRANPWPPSKQDTLCQRRVNAGPA